jgi:hypothetical protein
MEDKTFFIKEFNGKPLESLAKIKEEVKKRNINYSIIPFILNEMGMKEFLKDIDNNLLLALNNSIRGANEK